MIERDRIPPQWQEWWEERAAILEYDGGCTRAEAEAQATVCLQAYVVRLATREGDHAESP